MHQCLLVSDIFELIAQFSNEDGTTPAAVASLSRTCRSFHEIAEDVLWRRINGLTALMHCFGRDICGPAEGPCYFSKFPEGDDWQAFNRHAKRVQYLALGQSFDADAELRALQVLDLCRPDPKVAVLPNLRELRWCDLTEASFRYMSLFVHPGLVSFNALIITNPRLLCDTVAYLGVAAPGLRSLKVSPGAPEHEDSRVVDALGRMLASSADLAELSVRAPVSSATLPLLAYHPRLEVLSVRLLSTSLDGPLTADIPTFRSLRRLTAHAKSVDDVLPLLNMIESSYFSGLVLQLKSQPTASSLHHLFASVSRHKAFQSLTVLITSSGSHGQRPGLKSAAPAPLQTSEQYTLTSSSIRSLLGLSNLSHLILTQIPCEIDDCLLHDMALAWGQSLERLSLGTAARLENPRISIEGVKALAYACPRLSELALSFDSTSTALEIHASSNVNSIQLCNSNSHHSKKLAPVVASSLKSSYLSHSRPRSLSRLQTFDIGCSPIVNTQHFATFVGGMFPYARICDPHGSSSSSRRASVSSVHAEITKMRRQSSLSA